jgi:hypothetical protein
MSLLEVSRTASSLSVQLTHPQPPVRQTGGKNEKRSHLGPRKCLLHWRLNRPGRTRTCNPRFWRAQLASLQRYYRVLGDVRKAGK